MCPSRVTNETSPNTLQGLVMIPEDDGVIVGVGVGVGLNEFMDELTETNEQ
jgi:hypothetical protein